MTLVASFDPLPGFSTMNPMYGMWSRLLVAARLGVRCLSGPRRKVGGLGVLLRWCHHLVTSIVDGALAVARVQPWCAVHVVGTLTRRARVFDLSDTSAIFSNRSLLVETGLAGFDFESEGL